MNIEIREQNGSYTGILSGWIDTNAASQFLDELKLLEENADKNIVLDCGALEYICSLGLRGLLKLKKTSAAKGGSLVLTKVGGEIQKILTMTGFIRLFEIRQA
ncbi:MAG: STAS domain-containing protein [Prevotella sp.]|nr:STAS domain-containing protein [Prevotella sp.]